MEMGKGKKIKGVGRVRRSRGNEGMLKRIEGYDKEDL